jgi:hypothetical protein
MRGPLILAAALGACTLPNFSAPPPPILTDCAGFELVLPQRYSHWQPAIEERLLLVRGTLMPALERWSSAPQPTARVQVCADPAAAAAFLAAQGLRADPRVPRTFPARGLAVLPLPRDDRLLAALAEPPATWLQSLSHEAAHLLMAGRPELAAAPLWFQEGIAEAWREGEPQPSAHAWILPLPEAGDQPSERALDAWAAAALHLLATDAGPQPWTSPLPATAPAPPAAPAFTHRGREAHADSAAGLFLVASLPGEIVELDLPPLAPGERREWSLLLGTSGLPEGGMLLRPRGAAPLRLRCDSAGGLAAWTEDPARPTRSESSDRAGTLPDGEPRRFTLEHRGGEILIHAQNFARRFPLAEEARAYPVALILYVRDGACVARTQP